MAERLIADREAHREALRAAGHVLYRPWHDRTHLAADITRNFTTLKGREVTVAGRIGVSRDHGGVRFIDLRDVSGKIQLALKKDVMGNAVFDLLNHLDPGDILATTGTVMETARGEVSIDVRTWTPLTKALLPMPEKRAGLQSAEERARHRELDLLTRTEAQNVLAVRSEILRTLRDLLTGEGFMEVETPVLQHLAGGAAARPFRTHHEALGLDLFLRVSPELALKRLMIGGFEKVFEIARVFRNEGIDRHHNPEFTLCEFYQAYATVEDLIPLTEKLISTLIQTTREALTFPYQGQTLNFTPPWPRVSFVEAVQKASGVHVLEERDQAPYLQALRKLRVQPPEDQSLPNLLDELFTAAVRKKTAGPLFVTGAPVELEPLAKRDPDEPRLVQRVQLVVAGMELVKAYTEENDPGEQEARFRAHAQLRGAADVHPLDAEYIEALKIGLPPAAGWGMGVDRLTMLATDQPSIRDVLTFPLLRPPPGNRGRSERTKHRGQS